METCTASGQADTGIYVGQSQNVLVRDCTAFANVEGIAIENSSHVQVLHNTAVNNVAGITAFLLPQLTVKTSSDVRISGNVAANNNHVNFGEPGEPESALPSGIGILALGIDSSEIS